MVAHHTSRAIIRKFLLHGARNGSRSILYGYGRRTLTYGRWRRSFHQHGKDQQWSCSLEAQQRLCVERWTRKSFNTASMKLMWSMAVSFTSQAWRLFSAYSALWRSGRRERRAHDSTALHLQSRARGEHRPDINEVRSCTTPIDGIARFCDGINGICMDASYVSTDATNDVDYITCTTTRTATDR